MLVLLARLSWHVVFVCIWYVVCVCLFPNIHTKLYQSKQRPNRPRTQQRNTINSDTFAAFAPFRPDPICPGTPWEPRTNEVVCLYLSPHWPCFSGWESHEHRHAEARGNAHRGHPPTTREASSTLYVLNTRTAPAALRTAPSGSAP